MKQKSTTPVVIVLFGLAIVFFSSISSRPAAAAPLQQTVSNVIISNVNDVSFSVSWVTDIASDGHVDWDTSTPPGMTESDPVAGTTTHYVTIAGLTQNTTYFFQVRSGTTTDDNGGAYYSVTTGPSIGGLPGTKILFGQLKQVDDSTGVPYGIVYFRLVDNDSSDSPGHSQWGSTRANSSGDWFFNLTNLRVESLASLFVYTDASDQFQYVGQGGVYGLIGESGDERVEILPDTPDYPYTFDITLDADPTAIGLARVGAVDSPGVSWLLIAAGAVLLLSAVFIGFSRKRKTQDG